MTNTFPLGNRVLPYTASSVAQTLQNATPRVYSFSINPSIKNKPSDEVLKKTGSTWQTKRFSLSKVKELISKGIAINACELSGNTRGDQYFGCSDWIIVDIDNAKADTTQHKDPKTGKFPKAYNHQLTIAEALEHPFIMQCACMIYTSPSHKKGWDRFRIIFTLPESCNDPEIYRSAIALIFAEVPGCDVGAKSVTNLFFGNTNAEFPLYNESACLPENWLELARKHAEELKKIGKGKDKSKTERKSKREKAVVTTENQHLPNAVNAIHLGSLISKASVKIWGGDWSAFDTDEKGRRSGAIAALYQDAKGWENLLNKYSLPYCSNAYELCCDSIQAMDASDIDLDRLDSILLGISESACKPSQQPYKGEEGCIIFYKRHAKFQKPKEFTPEELAKLTAQWLERNRYTPDISYRKEFVDTEQFIASVLDPRFNIITLKSTMGTGKTEALIALFKVWSSGIVALGYRNSLLLQSNARWDESGKRFYHLRQDGATMHCVDPHSCISLCVDSLKLFGENDFNGKLVVLDEAASTQLHVLLSPTVRKQGRSSILEKFEQAIRQAAKVVLLDGNLSDRVVDWIKSIRATNASVCKIENTQPAAKLNVELITAVDAQCRDKKKLRDKSPIFRKLAQTLEACKNAPLGTPKAVAVIADGQLLLEAYEGILKDAGYKTLRLDRITAQKEDIKAVIQNPNQYILENQIDVLLMSPTVESGFDINLKNYFIRCFAIFNGLIGTASQMQFLRRIRYCHQWTMYCAVQGFIGAYGAYSKGSEIQNLQADYLRQSARVSFDGLNVVYSQIDQQIAENLENLHQKTAYEELAALHFERGNSQSCLKIALQNAGSFIKEIDKPNNDLLNKRIEEMKDEILLERGKKIFAARDMDVSEAREILSSYSASEEDTYAAMKAVLLDRLPGINDLKIWDAEHIAWIEWKSGKETVGKLERFWLINHLDDAKLLSQKQWLSICSNWNSLSHKENEISPKGWGKVIDFKVFYGHDIKNDYARLKVIKDLGFLDLLSEDPDNPKMHSASDEKIQKIVTKVRRSKSNQASLQRKVGSDPIKFINSVFISIGVRVHTKQERKGSDRGSRFYWYESPLNDELLAPLYQCVDQKFKVKAEEFTPPKPVNFDPEALHVEGIPHHSEWLDSESATDIDQMWDVAKEEARNGDVLAIEAVKQTIRDLWQKDPGQKFLADLGGKFNDDNTRFSGAKQFLKA